MMETILKAYGLWKVIDETNGKEETSGKQETAIDEKAENTAKGMIFQTLPQDMLMQVAQYTTANEVWNSIKGKHLGADLVQKARLQTLRSELETLKMKPHESTNEFAGKLSSIQVKFKSLGGTLKDKVLVRKLLNSVPKKFLPIIREIVPQLTLAGPTSFAPVIEQAMTILEKCGGQYHVLLIIADRQVGNVTLQNKSVQEKKMVDAIVQASKLPLSIVLVGVGDGPWDMMKKFDDNIPQREFDNFQFVNFIEIMSKNVPLNRKEAEFALSSLMEVPSQYKATIELNLLGCRRGNMPQRVARPPIRGPSSRIELRFAFIGTDWYGKQEAMAS
nr:E3 ubiquitin-protein ligase RGLG2-like [Tanacetum cinerariifolium]